MKNGSCSVTTVAGSAALPFVISTGEVMGQRPPKVMKNAFPATTVAGSAALPFVISTEAQRSGEICGVSGPSWECFSTERTRISYFALLATSTCAALRRESRMQIINATGLHRKSGGAEWRDLRSQPSFPGNVFRSLCVRSLCVRWDRHFDDAAF